MFNLSQGVVFLTMFSQSRPVMSDDLLHFDVIVFKEMVRARLQKAKGMLETDKENIKEKVKLVRLMKVKVIVKVGVMAQRFRVTEMDQMEMVRRRKNKYGQHISPLLVIMV